MSGSTSLPALGLIGTGPVARAVARCHVLAGGRIAAWASRDADRARRTAAACGAAEAIATDGGPASIDTARADVWIVAVPDRVIRAVGAALLPRTSNALVLHTSGALPGAELARDVDASSPTGSLHPLQTLSGGPDAPADAGRLADALSGAHWFHEGAGADLGARLVAAWRGRFHALGPGSKVLYHAAAAILSNHTVALHAMAQDLFRRAGIEPSESAEPLLSLLEGTLGNLRRLGQPAALTGPVARGDAATVAAHLAALRARAPELVTAYREMACVALGVARARGLDPAAAGRVQQVLDDGEDRPSEG